MGKGFQKELPTWCSCLLSHQEGLAACGDEKGASLDVHSGNVMDGHPSDEDPEAKSQ